MKTIIEPFRIKMVEPIRKSTLAERTALLKEAGYNLFRIPAEAITIDLLTDSGTGAMSARQWAALMEGDESYAGSKSFEHFETAVRDITSFRYVIPTHQGRAAERILAATLLRAGDLVPNNTHFDTTRAHIEAVGATALDIPCPESQELDRPYPFKGNLDLTRLTELLKDPPGPIPLVIATVTNNGGGGQPASMENLRGASELCHRHGVLFYLDACRFAENAFFIRQREPGYSNHSLLDIAREMFSLADGCTMSAKKDGLANIGAFLCTNDDRLAQQEEQLLILTEGFPTYGGLAGRDLEAVAVGLYEALDLDYQEYRHASVQYLGRNLARAGVPIVEPPGGHAIYIDAARLLDHLPREQYPGQALVVELYRQYGIRAVEIGSLMFGKRDPETGEESYTQHELIRLAVPRRVYTQSHIDYVVEAFNELMTRRKTIPGIRIVEQPERLRHFTARFELVLG